MSTLEWGDIQIFDRVFKVYGYDEDAWFQSVKLSGRYSEFNCSNLTELIGPDDICLDLGANVGMMTLAMAQLAPKGHIYAFEGSPHTTRALSETIKANKLDNVSAYCAVLGEGNENVKFFDAPQMRAAGFYVSVDNPRETPRQGTADDPDNFQVIITETKSVDQLVSELNLQRVDFIKIDVEGAELDVLQGAQETLKRFKPIVIVEFNSYTYVHLREISPRRALKKILELFDDVFYFKERTGSRIRIGDSEADQEFFLHNNLCNGFVDDLMCSFRGAELVKRGLTEGDRVNRSLTSNSTTLQLEGALKQKQSEIDALHASLNRSPAYNSTTLQLEGALKQKQSEIDALHASLSWRITAGLRHIRRLFK